MKGLAIEIARKPFFCTSYFLSTCFAGDGFGYVTFLEYENKAELRVPWGGWVMI